MIGRFFQSLRVDVGRVLVESGISLEKKGSNLQKDIGYKFPFSRHQQLKPYNYNVPEISESARVSSNAQVVGDVVIGDNTIVSHNATITGEASGVRIGNNVKIGNFSVINTSGLMPQDLSQAVVIGHFVNIGNGVSLTSNIIDDGCAVGDNSILLEGARMERYSVLADNSVLSQGTVIPSGQLWSGSPATFERNLLEGELAKLNSEKN